MLLKLPRNGFKYILVGCAISSVFWMLGILSYLRHTKPHNFQKRSNLIENKSPETHESPLLKEESIGVIRNDDDIRTRDEGYAKYAFNILVSDRIGLQRNLPDTRHEVCKMRRNTVTRDLPKASIIICYHNEARSTLMRTVYSVVDRTPAALLHEIILLDDFSDPDRGHDTLENYFKIKIPKVKMYKAKNRNGLIRGRMNAAKRASGEVLVFLDSHCEVNEGWLPPLLTRISEDNTRVLCPMIDIINADTFEYTSSPMVKGGFNWGLHFSWEQLSEEDLHHPKSFATAFRSPTMAGGLFAINRKYFFKLGGYDEGMDIWGGENLEISFRIWMCGGTLEFHPCSRVGHVFRNRRPYGNAGMGDTMGFNSQRVAEVWLDKYKMHFYNVRTDLRGKSFGDVTSRKELRKRLKCKSFSWFLEKVYPEIYIPLERTGAPFKHRGDDKKKAKIVYKAKLRNRGKGVCLDSAGSAYDKKMNIILRSCDIVNVQYWTFNKAKELKTEGILCLDVVHSGRSTKLKSMKCHGEGSGQEWNFSENSKRLYNPATGMCLASAADTNVAMLRICSAGKDQQWEFIEADR